MNDIRRYIRLVEFLSDDYDDDGDDGRDQTIRVFNIVWDVTPEEGGEFPESVTTTLHEVEEAADPYADERDRDDLERKIGNWLESTYDFGLSNFDYEII